MAASLAPFRRLASLRDGIHSRIFLFFLITVVLIIAVLSAILYVNFENILLSRISGSELDILSQISFSLTYLRQSSLNTCMQVFSNPDIAPLLFYGELEGRTLLDSLNRLSLYRRATTFISSIYIYNRVAGRVYADSNVGADTVFSLDDFYDRGALDIIRNYRQYGWLAPIPRTVPLYQREARTDKVYSFLFYDTAAGKADLDNAIVLNVSATWLTDLIRSMDSPSLMKNTLIIDHAGTVFSSTDQGDFLKDISDAAFVRRILGSKERSGYFTSDIDGKLYFVSFLHHTLSDLILIRTIPYDQLTVGIRKMQLNTLVVFLGVLLAGLLVSVFFLQFVKRAVKAVVDRLETAESRRKAEIPELRNAFLKSLASGKSSLDPDEYAAVKDELGIRLESRLPVAAVLFLIDGYDALSIRLDARDTQRAREHIRSTVEKVFGERCVSEVVDMEDERVLVIFNVGDDQRADGAVVDSVRLVQERLALNGGITVSAIVTDPAPGLADVSRLFERALAVSSNKIFAGHACVLRAADYGEPSSEGTDGDPHTKEIRRIVESLLKANLAEARRHYGELLAVAKREQSEDFRITMTRLAFEIQAAVSALTRDLNLSFPFNLNLFLRRLQQADLIDEINDVYQGLFADIVARLQQRRSGKHDQIAGDAVRIIRERYADTNLSVESVSREINISTAYLGKIFHSIMGKSMPSFINEVRMENARGLLSGTNETMDSIARSVGYTNTIYFHRMFRKLYGTTPLKYRREATRR